VTNRNLCTDCDCFK